jgi:hypothetical protein
MLMVHASPDWATVKACPAIVMVPVRASPEEFGLTAIVTSPPVAPLAPPVI